MNLIKYGDILLVDFRPPRGREVSKIRPSVVVSNNELNTKSCYVVVLPISGDVRVYAPFHLLVKRSEVNGLDKDSKVMPEMIRALDKLRIIKKIGRLEHKYMEHLEGKILYVLNQNAVP